MRLGRLAAYAWAAPSTVLGLLAVAVTGARAGAVGGVVEAHGPGVARWFARLAPGRGVVAMTLGHVVLACDAETLADTRAHERVHVRQYERWGAAFVPAYLIASAVAWARGGDAYRDNVFEREAWAQAPIGHRPSALG